MATDVPEGSLPKEDATSPEKPPETETQTAGTDGESSAEEGERQDSPDSGHVTNSAKDEEDDDEESRDTAPPLPDEEVPPLPDEAPPGKVEDDGWDPVWDDKAQAYYFYNRFTGVSQWENPRVPAAPSGPPGVDSGEAASEAPSQASGGYNPAIHGDYDPTAPYAQEAQPSSATDVAGPSSDPNYIYTATGTFNRFTGKWQPTGLAPENFNDENKSRRQLNAFFDVDAAANSHDGKSLRAERSGKKLTKKELKAFKEKRRERKEEKRRAWLRD